MMFDVSKRLPLHERPGSRTGPSRLSAASCGPTQPSAGGVLNS